MYLIYVSDPYVTCHDQGDPENLSLEMYPIKL